MSRRGVPSLNPCPRSSGEPWCDTLRDERMGRRLTQRMVADLCHVDVGTLTGWERGVNVKAMVKWRRWANALGYDIQLVRRDGDD